jgi:hypothetical protein
MHPTQAEVLKFVAWARPCLGITDPVRILLVNRTLPGTFGYFEPHSQKIVVSMLNRHPTDVIRTVAHELVHRAQHQHQPLSASDGVTGSDVENQANSVAGILMRMWSMNNL